MPARTLRCACAQSRAAVAMFVATTVDTVREMHDTDDVVLLLAAARASSRVADHGITSRPSRHTAIGSSVASACSRSATSAQIGPRRAAEALTPLIVVVCVDIDVSAMTLMSFRTSSWHLRSVVLNGGFIKLYHHNTTGKIEKLECAGTSSDPFV